MSHTLVPSIIQACSDRPQHTVFQRVVSQPTLKMQKRCRPNMPPINTSLTSSSGRHQIQRKNTAGRVGPEGADGSQLQGCKQEGPVVQDSSQRQSHSTHCPKQEQLSLSSIFLKACCPKIPGQPYVGFQVRRLLPHIGHSIMH